MVTAAIEKRVHHVASADGRLNAVDQRHGTLLATYDVGEHTNLKAPAVANGVVAGVDGWAAVEQGVRLRGAPIVL